MRIHALALLFTIAGSAAYAQDIVVPNGSATVEGGTSNNFPLSGNQPSYRYQQLYAASQFGAISGPQRLTEVRFRPNATSTFPAWSTTVTLDLRFSTTQAADDQLSTTFADNVGPDEVIVYNGEATYGTSQVGPLPPGPMPFDVVIPLQTPFLYDPSQGNLLMDVRRTGTTLTVARFLDAVSVAGDGVSRVYNADVNATVASASNTLGLVTQFHFEEAGTCYPDCNGDGALNLSDFGCFQTAFALGQPYADCNGDGVRNLSDFGCFQTQFALGCP
jgi:hypothetical protein